MNCEGGKNPHNTDIWAILAVKFDTVYKVLNYLPNTLIPTFYFPQYMRYHSPSWRVFIFPLCLSELWAPFRLRAAKKRSITSSRKTTRALSCWWESWLSMNPALFFSFSSKRTFFCPWWFSACHNHFFTRSLNKPCFPWVQTKST